MKKSSLQIQDNMVQERLDTKGRCIHDTTDVMTQVNRLLGFGYGRVVVSVNKGRVKQIEYCETIQ